MKLPVTLGHENVGEVVASGPQAQGVKIGDRRLVDPWIGCGKCAVCQRGEENLCPSRSSLGVFRHGGYSDYMMVPHPRYLIDIGDLPPEQAAPLACSGVTTYSALKKVGATLKTEPTVIIGAGGLGLMCIALHKAMGGKSVDRRRYRSGEARSREEGRRDVVIDGGAADAARRSQAATNGGAWAVIDLVGSSRDGPARHRQPDQGRQGDRRRPLRRRYHAVAAAVPDAGHHHPGLLCRQPDGDAGIDRSGAPTGLPPVPVATRPLDDVNAVLNDLRAGKVVGRVVLTPAG